MIPFKIFAPILIGITGVGWVISGIVQKPAPKTILDFVELGEGGCIKRFFTDRNGVTPKVPECASGGGKWLLFIKKIREFRLINYFYSF